jgi:hypothetical protein
MSRGSMSRLRNTPGFPSGAVAFSASWVLRSLGLRYALSCREGPLHTTMGRPILRTAMASMVATVATAPIAVSRAVWAIATLMAVTAVGSAGRAWTMLAVGPTGAATTTAVMSLVACVFARL